MLRHTLTLARFTWLEAIRSRLPWLAVFFLLAGIGLSGFLRDLAITESAQIQVSVLAAYSRLVALFLLALFVVTSMVREFNDKGLELTLSLPITRSAYLLGRLSGFILIGLALCLLFCLPLFLLASPAQVLLWGLSLALEAVIIAALSTLFVLTLHQPPAALSAVFATYFLARSISALQRIGQEAAEGGSVSQQVMKSTLDGIAYFLPRLDQFTQAGWLAHGAGRFGDLLPLAAQGGLFIALVVSAALFDLHRKNL